MLLIVVVTVILTIIASVITGRIVGKKATGSRLIDGMEMIGLHDVAQEMRNTKPVTPYYVIAGLAGAVAGLLVGGFLPMLMIAWWDLDFYEYRMHGGSASCLRMPSSRWSCRGSSWLVCDKTILIACPND